MNIVITTTWNTRSLIEPFLAHYKMLGFDRVIVMDFGSVDGTLDVLHSQKYRDFLEMVRFPGLDGLDSSQLMLEMMRERLAGDTGCLFCDPDELLVTPEWAPLWHLASTDGGGMTIPRFNMTGRLAAILADPAQATAFGALNLRIDGRCGRQPDQDMWKQDLDPPWIYSAIPGKIFVRLGRTISIGAGDHSAVLREGEFVPAPQGVYFLHYPIRSYEEFVEKVGMYRQHFELNPQLPQGWGWQARRWVRIARESRLRHEYEQQFPTDSLAEQLLGTGALVLDNSIKGNS